MLKKVNKSRYWKGVDFKHIVLQYEGYNFCNPTKRFCFLRCINYSTGLDFKETFSEFIKNKKRRLILITQARIQPCCKALNINNGFFNGKEIYPVSVTGRNKALRLYRDHFCVKWNSKTYSFNRAIQEIKSNFKMINNYKTDESFNSYFK